MRGWKGFVDASVLDVTPMDFEQLFWFREGCPMHWLVLGPIVWAPGVFVR